MTPFVPMHTVIPKGERGSFKISHFEFKEPTMRMLLGKEPSIRPGKYVQLLQGKTVWMSDTDDEQRTNTTVVHKAHGDVLIAGLGIGMILLPIFRKPEVRSVTVVEKYQEVIELVWPAFRSTLESEHSINRVHRDFHIVRADVYDWQLPHGAKWDTIYFDIWGDQSTDALKEMTTLKRRFARRKNPGGWMGCWREAELRGRLWHEKRSGW